MGISGSQSALMFAQAGVARAGATRFGHHDGRSYWAINGANKTADVRHDSASISDIRDDVPNTCDFTLGSGLQATKGQTVVVTLGSLNNRERLFSGRILTTQQGHEGLPANVVTHCHCVDHTWELNKRKVTKLYAAQDASLVIKDIIDTFTSGFTYAKVASSLGTLTGGIQFTQEEVTEAFTRVMRRVGGHWKVDYHSDVHAVTSAEVLNGAPLDIDTTHGGADRGLTHEVDLSQVITRVHVEGRGTTVSAPVAAGNTTVPVDDTTMLNASGGSLKADHSQILTYTAMTAGGGDGSRGSHAQAAPGAPTLAGTATVGNCTPGAHAVKVAFRNDTGTTAAGAASGSVTVDTSYTPSTTWIRRAAPSADLWSAIAYSPALDLYAAVAYGTNKVMTSPDGETWTARTAASSSNWTGIAWDATIGGGIFVAVGHSVAMSSTDGITWTSRTAAAAVNWTAVVSNGTSFVAVASSGTVAQQVMTSTNGTTWTSRTASANMAWSAITWAADLTLFIAVATTSGATSIMTSPAGTTWTTRTSNTGVFRAVTWSSALTLAVAVGERVGSDTYETSPDGVTWTERTTLPGRTEWWAIVWDADSARYVMVSRTGTERVAASTDGLAWTLQSPSASEGWDALVYASASQQLVAVSKDGGITTNDTTVSGETLAVSSIPTATGFVRDLYMKKIGPTASDTAYLYVDTVNDDTTTTYTVDKSDAELGHVAPEISSVGIAPGDTSIRVQDLSKFQGAPAWVNIGNQWVGHTGRSGSSGEGTLTGIPASGDGSIVSDIGAGVDVIPAGFVSGVPVSGAGAIVTDLEIGDAVHLYVTRNDATAQTALAALIGGDGIQEDFIQDRRLSETEAQDRGDGVLALHKDPIEAITYTTHDKRTASGKGITVNLGAPTSLSGTFTIQRVTITGLELAAQLAASGAMDQLAAMPLYQVEASSLRFSLEDILRRLRHPVASSGGNF